MASSTQATTTLPSVDQDYVNRLSRAEQWLVILVIGPIIVFGIVGNILSVITLRARPFRMFQSTFLLIALAFCDMAVLISNALYDWISKVTGDKVDLALNSSASCKVLLFAGSLFVMMSAWTLVLITLERVVSVLRPDMVHLFSVNRIRIGWAVMVGILILLHFYMLILFDIYEFPNYNPETGNTTFSKHCDFNPKHIKQIQDFNFWSDLFLGSIFPSLLIFTFNAIIIKRLTGPARQFGDRAMIPQPTKKPSSITVMLVVVSIVFLVTTLPVRLYQVGYRTWWNNLDRDPVQEAKDHFTYSCLSVLYYTNNAINFILYMVVNPSFRRTFFGILLCRKETPLVEENIGEPIASDHALQGAGYGSGKNDQEQLVQ